VIPLDALREMFGYNYWARDAQLEACEALTPEQFLRPMGNSFSSVRDTLAHLVAVEWIWCSRWRGKSPGKSESEAYAADKFPTLESVRQKWCDVELDVRDFLTNISEFELERDVSYTNLAGKHFTFHWSSPSPCFAVLPTRTRFRPRRGSLPPATHNSSG